MVIVYFFFFKQKTAYEMRISDWSSTCALPISPTRPARRRSSKASSRRSPCWSTPGSCRRIDRRPLRPRALSGGRPGSSDRMKRNSGDSTMPDGSDSLAVKVVSRIAEVPAAAWDACAGDNPFVSHAFLSALEDSGSATAETGWLPQHLVLPAPDGSGLLGCAPLYLKSHSYGERSEEPTSELQSLMRISYAVFCL